MPIIRVDHLVGVAVEGSLDLVGMLHEPPVDNRDQVDEDDDAEADGEDKSDGDNSPRSCLTLLAEFFIIIIIVITFPSVGDDHDNNDPKRNESEEEKRGDDPSPRAHLSRSWVSTGKDTRWLRSTLKVSLVGGGVRHKAQSSLRIVVHSVVIHEQRQSHDEEICVALGHQEDTDRPVLLIANVDEVLVRLNGDPLVVKHEVDSGEVGVAAREHVPRVHLVLVILHLLEDLLQEVAEVALWDDQGARSSVEDRVD